MSSKKLSLKNRLAQRLLMRVRPAFLASAAKKLLGIKRIPFQALHGVFQIDPVSQFGATLVARGEYEPELYECLQRHLPTGGTFLDIGANEGYFSILAARLVGVNGSVLAVEPQERLQPVLRENFRLNGVTNVRVLQTAVCDAKGEMASFYESPDTNTGTSGLGRSTTYQVYSYSVRVSTLSSLLLEANVEHVDLLKMDIEGFEYEAILGSPDVFRDQRAKVLAIEFHPAVMKARGKNPDEIFELLGNFGYRMQEESGMVLWFAESNDAIPH